MKARARTVWRCVSLLALCAVALQLTFAARIAVMGLWAPQSTSFERSEAWRLITQNQRLAWRQEWADYGQISDQLKRAVIASEDAAFTDHAGIDWDAIEKAWERNQRTEAKVAGGSTITQQLAKNLFLSGERTVLRKGQEFLLAMMLESVLSKQRILEIYLNHVEWGEGVFGVQAAARHYYRIDAARLGASQSARLAVMLPAPKRFEKRPGSAYVVGRAGTIAARMSEVEIP